MMIIITNIYLKICSGFISVPNTKVSASPCIIPPVPHSSPPVQWMKIQASRGYASTAPPPSQEWENG